MGGEIFSYYRQIKPTRNSSTAKLGNNQLIDIFSSHDSNMVTYFGKETSVSGNIRITTANEKVNLFDYNQIKDNSHHKRCW
ncbi:cytotoxic necrotizing factor Rho-activating domain-containing protein [Photorhabdus tasmaniensis]|uniref:cytotoxic necrotizing factor Rho-activating domain-containing protein n=1 Tax=Photorhabdus tasmaniensis TaxID=1004159 RepID=UPI004041FEF3